MRVPCTARSNQSVLKEINPEYSLEGLILKLKLQYFGHLMRRGDHWNRGLLIGSCLVTKSCVRLFETPWTAAGQASQSVIISWSLLRHMSIWSVMPSNHLILCHPFSSCLQCFPASGSFPMSLFFIPVGQSIVASTSVSVFSVNIQN